MSIALLLALAVTCELAGDILFKQGSTYHGVLYYLVGTVFWFMALKDTDSFGSLICAFTVANMVFGVLVGALLFQDAITAKNMVGVFLGILSIYLLV